MKVDYDINSRDISQARELILKSDGTRFRIFLEIVTSCLGNCTGCSLSYIHKRDFSPELNLEKIQEIFFPSKTAFEPPTILIFLFT